VPAREMKPVTSEEDCTTTELLDPTVIEVVCRGTWNPEKFINNTLWESTGDAICSVWICMDCGKFCAVLAPMASAFQPALVNTTSCIASGNFSSDQYCSSQ